MAPLVLIIVPINTDCESITEVFVVECLTVSIAIGIEHLLLHFARIRCICVKVDRQAACDRVSRDWQPSEFGRQHGCCHNA